MNEFFEDIIIILLVYLLVLVSVVEPKRKCLCPSSFFLCSIVVSQVSMSYVHIFSRGLALFGFLFLYSVPIQFCFLDRFLNGLQVHDACFARVLLIPLVSTIILSHSSLGSARENTLTHETQRKMIMLICSESSLRPWVHFLFPTPTRCPRASRAVS